MTASTRPCPDWCTSRHRETRDGIMDGFREHTRVMWSHRIGQAAERLRVEVTQCEEGDGVRGPVAVLLVGVDETPLGSALAGQLGHALIAAARYVDTEIRGRPQ